MYIHAIKQHTCNDMPGALVEYLENGTIRILYRCPNCAVQVIWLRAQLIFPGHRELVGRCDCPRSVFEVLNHRGRHVVTCMLFDCMDVHPLLTVQARRITKARASPPLPQRRPAGVPNASGVTSPSASDVLREPVRGK